MKIIFQLDFLKREHIYDSCWNYFIKKSTNKSVYYLCEYLDIICPNWCAYTVKYNSHCIAIMPINISYKYGIKYSLKPYLAQFLGPIFADKINDETKASVLELLSKQLGQQFNFFDHCLHPSLSSVVSKINFRKFIFEKFHSYELNLNDSDENIYKNFSTSVTNHIRKAQRKGLRCIDSRCPLWLAQSLVEQNIISKEQSKTFLQLAQHIISQNQGFILYSQSQEGITCAGGLFIINFNKVTFIGSASNPDYKKYGGNSMLIWEAIKKCRGYSHINTFDFEGSMLPNIEKYFVGFRPQKIFYYRMQLQPIAFIKLARHFIKYLKT